MQAEEVITVAQRNEEQLTEHLSEPHRDPSCGGWLVGLEHRRKGEERLKEKITDLLETGAPDATAGEILQAIPDAIRYTFCAEPDNYTETYWDIKLQLQATGLEMDYSQNHWADSQYKGINTRWVTPDGQRFEVQFHTPESFHARERVTHQAYERLRSPLTGDQERQELRAFQQEICSSIPAPEGAVDIPNYRKAGR
jgi:hypothetical protein